MAFEIFKVAWAKGKHSLYYNIQIGEIRNVKIGVDYKRLRRWSLEYMRKHNVVLSWEKQEDGSYKIKRES